MAWPEIIGHESIWECFRRSIAQGRLASTFLFVGPPGIGKRTTALKLAQALLCSSTAQGELSACETCPECQQVTAQTHPDLLLIEKPADRNFIPIELFIGDREHRMQAGLCHDISLKPFSGQRKIAIIDDADHLNQEGANCLLKTLEEPPGKSLIILIGTSQHRQLPTIRSRCQIIRFSPLDETHIAKLLTDLDWIQDTQQASRLASRADGSLHRAMELADEELEQACSSLLMQLSHPDIDSIELTREISSFVEAAGRDAPTRRVRIRQLILALISLYRHLMRDLAGAETRCDETTAQFVRDGRATFVGGPPSVAKCLERCHAAMRQVDANANVATLIACWIDDLAQATLHAAGRRS